MKFGVVILGAGASRRMGKPKLLLPWKETTIIGHLIEQWNELGADQIAIVLSEKNVPLTSELDRLGFSSANRIINSKPGRGMFSSIQRAASSVTWGVSLTHFVITLGDQPHLKIETLRKLIEFSTGADEQICEPSLHGRPKHPVVLPRHRFEQLASTEVETLKEFLDLNRDNVALVEINDGGLSVDLDTPEDYQQALQRFGDR